MKPYDGKITRKKIESIAGLAGLHVRVTETGYTISNGEWAEKFTAPREVMAFLRGYIRGKETHVC